MKDPLTQQARPVLYEWMLASDLDGTLIPQGSVEQYDQRVAVFTALFRDRDRHKLAYVTGRDLSLTLAGIQQTGLPIPDVMICDVGTRLYTRQEERWQLDPIYRHRLQERLGAESIQAAVCSVAIPQGVALQEADRQSDFKCSYYTEPTVNVHAVLEDLQRQFEKQHVHVTPVFSVDPVKHCGLLDILPRDVGKDFGLQYLAEVFGLSHDNLLFSGDSGNDLRGFFSGFSAIVVGNASESVKRQVQNAAAEDRLVRAYISQACLVEGVLEGLQHYGVLLN